MPTSFYVQRYQRTIHRFHGQDAHDRFMTEQNARATAASFYIEGQHSNPENVEFFRYEILQMLSSLIGIYCMSERNDSVLMWAHYGNKHTGYCVEFEASDDTPFFGASQPVRYSTDYPTVDFFSTPREEQVDPIFLTKSLDWNYEREWRIIEHEHGRGEQEYPGHLMTGVIFGMRMTAVDKNNIKDWLSRRDCNVDLYQANRHDSEFSIVILPHGA